MAGRDVREDAVLPQPRCGRRNVIPVVDLLRLLLAQGVREDVVELLRCEPERIVALRRVSERWKERLDLRQGLHPNTFGRGAVDRDGCGAEAAVEEQLHEDSAERMPHDDRWL